MDYEAKLDLAIGSLHEVGRYRTFIDIERRNGNFPHAVWTRPDGSEQDITSSLSISSISFGSLCGKSKTYSGPATTAGM